MRGGGSAGRQVGHTEGMLHWRLLSNLARALLVAAAAGLVAAIVLTVAGHSIAFLYGAVIVVLLAGIIVRRRDLNLAIARQLQREADDAAGRRAAD